MPKGTEPRLTSRASRSTHTLNKATTDWPWRLAPQRTRNRPDRAPSTKPRPTGRVDRIRAGKAEAIWHNLQRSHGRLAVETSCVPVAVDVFVPLQRSHGRLAVETRPVGAAGTVAPDLQRSHGRLAVETHLTFLCPIFANTPFNEATADWPWRLSRARSMTTQRGIPSTKPRPTGRGDPPSEPGRGRTLPPFNEATADWPWRHRATVGCTT